MTSAPVHLPNLERLMLEAYLSSHNFSEFINAPNLTSLTLRHSRTERQVRLVTNVVCWVKKYGAQLDQEVGICEHGDLEG